MRYQRQFPGELLHFDIKKLGALSAQATASPTIGATARAAPAGNTSMSASMMLPASLSLRSCPTSATPAPSTFLQNALAYFASLGIKTQRLMSDNGSCYRSHHFRTAVSATSACATLHPPLYSSH